MNSTLAVTGWTVLSPFGFGAPPFGAGVATLRTALRPPDDPTRYPQPAIATIDGFDVRERLGRKGTRSMDRATGLAVATVGMLLDERRAIASDVAGDETALVLGTTTGSAKSMMDFTEDSLVQDKPYHVDPARFPNTVMNCAAGQCAIWHGLTGPNTTIAGGRGTVLSALSYASRLHRGGHAKTILCGAVEELSERRAWLEWHSQEDDPHRTPGIGEGCAMFLLEPAAMARAEGRPVNADILALNFLHRRRGEPIADAVTEALRSCLERAKVSTEEVWAVADEHDDAAIRQVFGPNHDAVRHITVGPLVGDTGAVTAGMQLVSVLAQAQDADVAGRVALLASADRDGTVGALAVRLG